MSIKQDKIRPVYINLFKIKLPMSAVSSITHRLSGIYIFFITLPLLLYLLYFSTRSYNDFVNLKNTLNNSVIISTFVTFSLLVFVYHVLTGVRHLLQDIHIGESPLASKLSSYIVFILWFALVFVVILNLFLL
jgi:succinate dehydrogenase / fumarate reductase cytochrome b subunit|tara:strand:+ start:599 stop:997 length:399 start_codon:yes stop_codon:yes gene_type:complete